MMLPKFPTLLLALALFGFTPRNWAQGGTLVAWGDNRTGQATVPVGLNNVVSIASGEWHNLALKADGTLVAWGYNAGVPWDVNNVVSIGAGGYHNMAIMPDGTVRAWGANDYGQINVPEGLNNVVEVKGGWVHSLALKSDGTVVAWGRHTEGQTNVPAGLNNVVAIAAGEYHNLALKSDGTVVGWGWNGMGQAIVPHTIANNNFIAIAAGGLHSLGLKSDGTVVAWGWNLYGQSTVPPGLSNVVAIAGGAEHSLALKSDGTVVGWGANDAWASNDPDCAFVGSSCPRVYSGQVDIPPGLNNVVAISAGVFHSLALQAENTVQPPSAPVLSVGAVGETTVTLTWSDLSNETGYRLEARVGTNGNWAEIATPAANATSYQHTGLTAGATMFYRLRAFNTGGTSLFSAEVSATTSATAPTPPVAPTLAATVQSPTSVDLAWNDVDHESGYSIERRTGTDDWLVVATPAANTTSFSDSSLTPATTYLYRIRALSPAGNSLYSAEIQARTERLSPPAAPTLSTTANSHSTIALAWSDVANESGYKLEVKNSAGTWTELATLDTGITTFNHAGLNASTAYTYRVSAFNAAGSSPLSSELTVTTSAQPQQPPGQPVLAGTVASHSSVNLSWSGVANAAQFRIERRLANSTTWAEIARIPAGTTNHLDTGLTAGTAYVYRLRAFNTTSGFSAYSEELILTTAPAPVLPPAAPTFLATAISPTEVQLEWNDVTNELTYTIERRLDTATEWTTVTTLDADATSFTEPGLAPETTYLYRIRAANSGGESAWTEVTVSTPAQPLEVQSSATFVQVDDQTSGLWPLEFGTDGKWIATQSPDLPAEVTVTLLPESPVVWSADSSEARALIGPGGTNRIAAGWSGSPLTVNLDTPRGTPRRISLYFVDWDRTDASQQIAIRDAATGTNLDTRSIETFGDGKYLVYDIDGNVEVTLTSSEGDAVLSGIFIGDGMPAPISNKPLTFQVLGADPNGLRVRITGDSGQRFKLQTTTDFQTWTDLANSILISPSTDITLPREASPGFFRTANTQ